MSERTGCIYCFSTVPPKGVEHVVSKAIGVFEHNWTLDCVCDACNSHFSKTLDLNAGPRQRRRRSSDHDRREARRKDRGFQK
jgi:hypothetical protein